MPRIFNLWESNSSKMPVDPKERAALLQKHMEMTQKMLTEKHIIDWGVFADGSGGYALGEENAIDSLKRSMQFSPYYKFHMRPVLSVSEAMEALKSMMG